MQLQTAQRQQVKLRLGISGPSGFGKTYSALLLAFGITEDYNKIAVIDTENGSASLYAHLGDFKVINLEAPYPPERYVHAIEVCEKAGIEVIIIDSITHEWNGAGGCLEIHEKLGGRFQDWSKVSPRHQTFIDKILQSQCHVITSVRRKVNYSMDTAANGKTKVIKHGTKEITREGFEYELTVNFELLNEKHLVKASKDRTGLFMNKPEFVINSATGKKLVSWCLEGIKVEEIRKEINQCETLEGLRHVYSKYPNLQSSILEEVLKRKMQLEEARNAIVPNHQILTANQKEDGAHK
ncbi:MAG: AAA family ATPase [Pseudooceanicola sp.]|nr:AAA family ATPase [Pseudooceanicola sp.]|tara:strand:+ start:2755 stop:3642 length:888 start_codon:yes stop_codon:yes gene_type:complete